MQTTGGATPLMYACQQCREHEVLDILRKQPYAVKDRDRTLKTPLHYCAENSSTSCAEAILKIAPELVNAQDENGYSALHLAVIAGNKALIKLLITKGADINIHDNEGHSAVHWAIVSSEKEALEMIIRAGANPSTPDVHGGYPLHYAVQMCGSNCDYIRNFEDTVKVVETLLSFGVNVNVRDKDGRQPILWAASAGSADAIVHLISGGACVEAADKDGLTGALMLNALTGAPFPCALHCAASRGHTTTLETLITLCGANVDVIDGNGCSALFYAVTLGHADATELLLRLGAEPNRQDRKGRTPAHCGAAKGQLETLRILKKHDGNLWLRNVRGDIPLHEAVASGRRDLVLWLLSQNPDAINVANNDGRCLIHIASMYNNTDMVKVLLDSKSLVNPVMRTSKGILMTPLNVALCKGHRSCGKFLQLHGGVPFSKVSKVETNAVYAVRISPSDDMMMTKEVIIESITPSHSKVSTNKSSADSHVLKVESADKKKVYRRRKKKKSSSNVDRKDSDSDSDDSYYELKAKATEIRINGRMNNDHDEDETKRALIENKKVVKEKDSDGSLIHRSAKGSPSGKKVEIQEESIAVKRATKIKTESKTLQRNKSFSETKNVSDLSPEDFPPMMQSIKKLDTEMTEAEIEISKPLGEGEVDTLKVPHLEISTSGDSESAQKEEEEKNDMGHKEKGGDEYKTTPSFTVIETDENEKTGGGKDAVNEESGSTESGKHEKSTKIVAKRSNGGGKKDSARSSASSGSKSSNEESLTRRGEKHGRSSNSKTSSDGVRKDEKLTKTGAKSSGDGLSDGSDKIKKSSSSSKSSRSGGSSVVKDDRFLKVPGRKVSNVEASPELVDKPKTEPTNPDEASARNEKVNTEPEIFITDDAIVVESEKTTNATDAVLPDEVAVEKMKTDEGDEISKSGAETKAHDGVLGGGDEAPVMDPQPKSEGVEIQEEEKSPETSELKPVKPDILVEEAQSNLSQDPQTTEPQSLPPETDVASELLEIKDPGEESSIKKEEGSLDPTVEGSNVEVGDKTVGEAEREEIPGILVENPSLALDTKDLEEAQKEETSVPAVEREVLLQRVEESLAETTEAPTELVFSDGTPKTRMDSPEKDKDSESKSEGTGIPLPTLPAIADEEVPGAVEDPPEMDQKGVKESEEKVEAGNDNPENSVEQLNGDERIEKEGKTLEINSTKNNEESAEENSAPEPLDPHVEETNEEAPGGQMQRNQTSEPPFDPHIKETNESMAGGQRQKNSASEHLPDSPSKETNEETPGGQKQRNQAPEPPFDPHIKETNEWMAGGQRHYKHQRVSRLCRRHREFRDDVNDVSVTQLVQNTIRKYHMERGIFYQLLELKRLQIRAGRANEQVLVKRLADEYERSRVFVGMKHFSGLYKFREFEKFLYDQLKSLNSRHSFAIPELKSYDDIDALSGILKKSRYKIISEIPESERICTCITQRCHHSACAYTNVPCSAYITNYRRHKSLKPKKECFFPRIDQSPNFRSERQNADELPATLELIQGNEKQVITLPHAYPDKGKRYYVTFTIKGSPSFKEDRFFEDPKEYFKHRHAKSV